MPFISGRNYIIRIMLPWLFRRPATSFDTSHQTDLAMVGARAGDTVVVLGASDAGLAGALARVTGADGQLVVVDDVPDADARLEAAAGLAAALVQYKRAPLTAVPVDADSANVAVLVRALGPLQDADRVQAAAEALRMIRPGGRLIVIEAEPHAGPLGMLRRGRATLRRDAVMAILASAGWKTTREIGDVDGVVYIEATKSRT
jgi:ubiquinone/menaquinone biosynthesis C-methylase UbiE